MKPKIAILVALALMLGTTTFASGRSKFDPEVFNTFDKKFSGAKEVSWKESDKYVKATFKLNDQRMSAYFTQAGELIGVSRNVLISYLPVNLQIELKKQVQDGWITELLEFSTEETTVYYATIEKPDQKVTIKSSGASRWLTYKKVKKEAL